MLVRQPVSLRWLLAGLRERIERSGGITSDELENLTLVDREAFLCLRDVAESVDEAAFELGFWLGCAEGSAVLERLANAQIRTQSRNRERSARGAAGSAKRAQIRWQDSAEACLVEIAARYPSYGEDRLTTELFKHRGFKYRGEEPALATVKRFIRKLRRGRALPPRAKKESVLKP